MKNENIFLTLSLSFTGAAAPEPPTPSRSFPTFALRKSRTRAAV